MVQIGFQRKQKRLSYNPRFYAHPSEYISKLIIFIQ
jgi:hypothetical protein